MHTLAIINQKGGVGKTTTAVNLAAALARAGQRVGLIDLDPQAHATLHLGTDPRRPSATTYDLLTTGTPLADLWVESADGVQVAPAHIDLAAVELELAAATDRERILRKKIEADPSALDYLLLDCPPSLGVLTINALAAADDVFLPLQPHFLALHGLSKLMQTVDLVTARLNPELKMAGVVLCMYEAGTRLAGEVRQDVQAFFAQLREQGGPWAHVRLFDTRIRRNIRLAEAPSHGQSIFAYDDRSRGAEDYSSLAGEVLAYFVGREIALTQAA